jgi:hypothetical protein
MARWTCSRIDYIHVQHIISSLGCERVLQSSHERFVIKWPRYVLLVAVVIWLTSMHLAATSWLCVICISSAAYRACCVTLAESARKDCSCNIDSRVVSTLAYAEQIIDMLISLASCHCLSVTRSYSIKFSCFSAAKILVLPKV